MKIKFHDQKLRDKIESLEREHPKIYNLVETTLSVIEDEGFKALEDLKKRGFYKQIKDDLFELRIPPRGKGGVFRIYFIFHKEEKDTIVLLDAELKKRNKADIKRARERAKEYEQKKNRRT